MADGERGSEIKVALISVAGVVVATLIGLIAAVITAHSNSTIEALGGPAAIRVTVSPSPYPSPSPKPFAVAYAGLVE